MKREIGGNRLGSGSNMQVEMRNYERSTHDLGYLWRSTMATGTLVPFLNEIALPGDTMDIRLNADVKTHPTIGPLFGSAKLQLDVFTIPVRLYIGLLHNNKLNVGLNMNNVKTPKIAVIGRGLPNESVKNIDNWQIEPSSLLAYLNIRGTGINTENKTNNVTKNFNAINFIGYWDIYKNYYANKQEEIGVFIHDSIAAKTVTAATYISDGVPQFNIPEYPTLAPAISGMTELSEVRFDVGTGNRTRATELYIYIETLEDNVTKNYKLSEAFGNIVDDGGSGEIICTNPINLFPDEPMNQTVRAWAYIEGEAEPRLKTFDLANIDTMRENLQKHTTLGVGYEINSGSIEPYGDILGLDGENIPNVTKNQEGLALKTYQADLFNNWMKTDWITNEDGTGINDITAVSTEEGSFTIDTLNLAKKVYDMLNRIAISGGSYRDWLETVYTHEVRRVIETPVYMGGLSKEIGFEEVISTAESGGNEGQPLGTLAGRGVMGSKHKGGNVTVKVDEISIVMGLVSITPRIDYSQGNKWDVDLDSMDDFHKPALDEIGFQDLVTTQMAWWERHVDNDNEETIYSAGKQPAWINYMTNVNIVRGNFAKENNEMFMTFNRRYEFNEVTQRIEDLTSYIDPVKYNHIFAQTSRDAQNYWVQINVKNTARRKMSSKVMPNL